jgi:hypothetical protein
MNRRLILLRCVAVANALLLLAGCVWYRGNFAGVDVWEPVESAGQVPTPRAATLQSIFDEEWAPARVTVGSRFDPWFVEHPANVRAVPNINELGFTFAEFMPIKKPPMTMMSGSKSDFAFRGIIRPVRSKKDPFHRRVLWSSTKSIPDVLDP